MKVECYAVTRPQDGRTGNEDAFLIIREGIPVAAVCDGAGAAEQVAKQVLRLFGYRERYRTPFGGYRNDFFGTDSVILLERPLMHPRGPSGRHP